MKRNFLFFTLFRIVPKILKNKIYDNGRYLSQEQQEFPNSGSNLPLHYNIFKDIIKNTISSDKKFNSFVIIHSMLPHTREYLTKDYQIATNYDEEIRSNIYFNEPLSVQDYQINMLTFNMLSSYLRKLKEIGVYDNTRIIIISDHSDSYKDIPHIDTKIVQFNSLMWIKDFNAKGLYKTSDKFMTGADTPYLSLINVIDNPINPFTGYDMLKTQKDKGVDIIPHRFRKVSPRHYEDKNRTYFYNEKQEYMHIDEQSLKKMINLEGELN